MAPVLNRIHLIDDSGSGEDGTILDDALFQTLQDNIDALSPAILAAVPPPVALSDNQTVSASGVLVLGAVMTHYVNNNAGADITLTFPAPGMGSAIVGERIIIVNAIGSVVRVAYGGNVVNAVTSAPTPIANGGSATWTWYGGAWRLTAHEQGATINVPYLASNFSATSGTFTVDPGDLAIYSFYLKGRVLMVHVNLATATLSTNASNPIALIPGGFKATTTAFYVNVIRGTDNGTLILGGMVGTAANTPNLTTWINGGGGGWQAQTNLLGMEFSIVVDVL
jgi:hypothetical protein